MKAPFALVLLASTAVAQLGVTAVDPSANVIDASTATALTVTFDANVDAATVSGSSFQVFGRWSGVRTGAYAVNGNEVRWSPDEPFFPGETVTVALTNAIQSTGGAPLTDGYVWMFWTRSNPGTDEFPLDVVTTARQPGEGLIQSYGIYAGDLDGDGSPDFSIPNEVSDDVRVMLNNGCGSYSTPAAIYPLPAGAFPSANEGADFDKDGDVDLATANIGGDTTSVLLGDGAGGYLAADTFASGDAPRGVAVLDVEADGDADLAIALRGTSRLSFHYNAGNGTFSGPDYFEAGVVGETSVVTVDANGDGLPDLYVGGYDSQTISSVLNGGAGTFGVHQSASIGGTPWMLAAGDVDGDGVVDAAACNSFSSAVGVICGDGSGGFDPVNTYPTGVFNLAIDLGDTDGDGDLDLISSNYNSGDWTYLRNDGTGMFGSPTTFDASFAGSCMIIVDYDRDGDMDLVGIDEISDEIFQFPQTSPVPAGVQLDACSARLRINNLAGFGGYGGVPAHPVELGENLFVGITSEPGTAVLGAFGVALQPGAPTGFGLVNLFPALLVTSDTTDAFGESLVAVQVPAGLTPGVVVGFQGIAVTAVPRFTNPEAVVLVP